MNKIIELYRKGFRVGSISMITKKSKSEIERIIKRYKNRKE